MLANGTIGIRAEGSDDAHIGFYTKGNIYMEGCLIGTLIGDCLSDVRLKENIRSIPSVLNKVAQLRPVYFDWKKTAISQYISSPEGQVGLIAQEVQKVFPEMVQDNNEDGFLRVEYTKLPFLMLRSIQELKSDNDSLFEAIKQQQAQILVLQAEVRALLEKTVGVGSN